MNLVITGILIFVMFQLYGKMTSRENNFWGEFFLLSLQLLVFFLLGFTDNRGGLVFVFLIFLSFFFLKLVNSNLFIKILLFGVILLGSTMISFKSLQISDELLYQYLLEKKYKINFQSFLQWDYNEKDKIWSNSSLKIQFPQIDDLFFQFSTENPMRIGYSGGGIGALSASEKNPNLYPYIKMILLPEGISYENFFIEYKEFLDRDESKGDIESIVLISDEKTNWRGYQGSFWRYYDRLRPRYVKTGYFFIKFQNGFNFILEIRENYSEEDEHTTEIKLFLDTVILGLSQ
jgi:hypothetical protein